ncbi:hypothetical protein JZO86_14400 [Enterococcus ureasiticus]|uniref:hypothetical protein n=1 Tax=Enterococcus ureasiticus TaxID=903984 RepID=UPI001A8CC89D|nr:hypothetical protein [Enterococcus ureasiticus]MBO0474890.1 hypothetical protein [Enterococcus ureasiticus]
MKRMNLISLTKLLHVENGRVQLFSKRFYRLNKGKVTRQISMMENGELSYVDWGSEKELSEIYSQIKLLFDPKGKIVAIRLKLNEPLIAKKESIWNSVFISKQQRTSDLLRGYEENEAMEYYLWLKHIRAYCYQKYGSKGKQLQK